MSPRFLHVVLAMTFGCVAFASNVEAGHHFSVKWNGSYHKNNAGEMLLTINDDAWSDAGLGLSGMDLSHYADSTGTYNSSGRLESYVTFCVEKSQTVNLNNDYTYEGIGSAVIPENDVLSNGTAFLYSQFATGELDGYHYDNDPANSRKNDAEALQLALWYLEGEISESELNDLARDFLGLAIDAYGADVMSDYTGGAVKVWQDSNRQDLLIMTGSHEGPAVPEPASMLIWGAFAAAGVVAHRRRRRTA